MQIKKLGYSRSPWRLLDDDGNECYVPAKFDHPDMGPTMIDEPVCADTKAELIEKVLRLFSGCVKRLRELQSKI